jgi:hypothetical protein
MGRSTGSFPPMCNYRGGNESAVSSDQCEKAQQCVVFVSFVLLIFNELSKWQRFLVIFGFLGRRKRDRKREVRKSVVSLHIFQGSLDCEKGGIKF